MPRTPSLSGPQREKRNGTAAAAAAATMLLAAASTATSTSPAGGEGSRGGGSGMLAIGGGVVWCVWGGCREPRVPIATRRKQPSFDSSETRQKTNGTRFVVVGSARSIEDPEAKPLTHITANHN